MSIKDIEEKLYADPGLDTAKRVSKELFDNAVDIIGKKLYMNTSDVILKHSDIIGTLLEIQASIYRTASERAADDFEGLLNATESDLKNVREHNRSLNRVNSMLVEEMEVGEDKPSDKELHDRHVDEGRKTLTGHYFNDEDSW